jgi:hypothetical protein
MPTRWGACGALLLSYLTSASVTGWMKKTLGSGWVYLGEGSWICLSARLHGGMTIPCMAVLIIATTLAPISFGVKWFEGAQALFQRRDAKMS